MKELRLRGISTIEAANAFAAEFAADFNARFGKEPRNPKNMHRPLADHENLAWTKRLQWLPRCRPVAS